MPVRLQLARVLVAVALALVACLLVASSPHDAPSAEGAAGPGSRIQWQGRDWYLHGVNVPWYRWGCDFGCGANGGVSSTSAAIEPRFAQLQAADVHSVRWWMFSGDPWQVSAAGVDANVYRDIDAALQLAEQYDLYYTFSLFSGPSAVPSSWLTSAATRQQIATTLGGLFGRYAGHPRVLSWEVFNEPDLDIWRGRVREADVQAFVATVAAAVHAHSSALVSVGSGMLDGLPMWVGLGLDYYDAHWYDNMASGDYCARCTDYRTVQARYGLDAPLVIGEFFAGAAVDAAQRYEDWYRKGFAGAWAWSLFPERTSDGMSVDLAAAASFAAAHGDDGPSASGGAVTRPPATAVAAGGSSITSGSIPARGFGLFVFSGGSSAQLLGASGCTGAAATFWAATGAGGLDVYIPAAAVAAVNASWSRRFAAGIPAGTPLIGRCQ